MKLNRIVVPVWKTLELLLRVDGNMNPGPCLNQTADDRAAKRAGASCNDYVSVGKIEHGRGLSLERRRLVHNVRHNPSSAIGSSTSAALDRTSSLMCVRMIRLQVRRGRCCMIVV